MTKQRIYKSNYTIKRKYFVTLRDKIQQLESIHHQGLRARPTQRRRLHSSSAESLTKAWSACLLSARAPLQCGGLGNLLGLADGLVADLVAEGAVLHPPQLLLLLVKSKR
jgi:hypothetical protein